MNTAFVLMAQYNGMAIISLEQVCADYFTHLTPLVFQRKVLAGEIKLPITRLDGRAVGQGIPGPVYQRLYAGYQQAVAALST